MRVAVYKTYRNPSLDFQSEPAPVAAKAFRRSDFHRKIRQEFYALAYSLGFLYARYGHQRFQKTYAYRLGRIFGFGRFFSAFKLNLAVFTMMLIVAVVPLFQAFEAHVVNVTATPVQIDPPLMKPPRPPGPWNNTVGATDLTGPIKVHIAGPSDSDATNVYYTFGPGTMPEDVPDPVCGGFYGGPNGWVFVVNVSEDTVVKAIACNGTNETAQRSVINTKIYTFAVLGNEGAGEVLGTKTEEAAEEMPEKLQELSEPLLEETKQPEEASEPVVEHSEELPVIETEKIDAEID